MSKNAYVHDPADPGDTKITGNPAGSPAFEDRCDCLVIHQDAVDMARAGMGDADTVLRLSEFFKVFGDPSRLRILQALMPGELCVCDLAALLGMRQSAVSHQLKILRQERLLKPRREGKIVYYCLDDGHVASVFSQGLQHVEEGEGRP